MQWRDGPHTPGTNEPDKYYLAGYAGLLREQGGTGKTSPASGAPAPSAVAL